MTASTATTGRPLLWAPRRWASAARIVLVAIALIGVVALSFALGHQTRQVTRHVVTTVQQVSADDHGPACFIGPRPTPCL